MDIFLIILVFGSLSLVDNSFVNILKSRFLTDCYMHTYCTEFVCESLGIMSISCNSVMFLRSRIEPVSNKVPNCFPLIIAVSL